MLNNTYEEEERNYGKKIYFSTIDGKLVSNYDISRMALAVSGKKISCYDFDLIREYAKGCLGIVKEITNPSVRYLVNRGFKVQATMIYYERHPGITLTEAKRVVDKMERKR